MEIKVLVFVHDDGSLEGASSEVPQVSASGADENEFSKSLITAFWGYMGFLASEGTDLLKEEIKLSVHHMGLDPAAAAEMDWEVVMPSHSHF